MAYRPLNQSFDTIGDWYLPDAPNRRIAGGLHYTADRTELHLNETFRPLPLRGEIRLEDNLQSYPTIHGVTREGEAVTLLNAQRAATSIKFASGGLRQPEKIISSWLLVGAHLPEDFAYSKISFRIPGLQIWLSKSNIEQSLSRDDETGEMSLTYSARGMAKETTRIASIESNLDWNIGFSSNSDKFTNASVTVSAWVTIHPDTPKQIEWFIQQQNIITTMLAFLAGSPMSTDCIEASVDDSPRTVSVMVALRDAKYCPYTDITDFYMPRAAMQADLTTIVCNWFGAFKKVQMPSQLALSIMAAEKLWRHVEFLSLMQALEGFHRALYESNYMDDGSYEAVCNALVAAIPQGIKAEHKESLKSRIRYGNQFSLRKRLTVLANLFPESIRTIILGSDGNIPREWIDTRNYYTHWDEELRSNVLDPYGMYCENIRMRHFLRALYLNLMGIPNDAIIESLRNRCDASQHLIQLNARAKQQEKKERT